MLGFGMTSSMHRVNLNSQLRPSEPSPPRQELHRPKGRRFKFGLKTGTVRNSQVEDEVKEQVEVVQRRVSSGQIGMQGMVRRRSVQINPYVYTVKQHSRSKVQDIMIDATKKKTPKKEWSIEDCSRSQSQCLVMESESPSSRQGRLHQTLLRNFGSRRERRQANPSEGKGQVNPYTQQQYIHERNRELDKLAKVRQTSKMNHPTSIIKSYQVLTVHLHNPLHLSQRPTRRHTHQAIPECYLDAQDENLQELLEEDVQKLRDCKDRSKHRRLASGYYKQPRLSHRPRTGPANRPVEDQPAPWQADFPLHESLELQDSPF